MARRSSIDRLPAPIREAVEAALKNGATIGEVVARVADMGVEVSRSAVGRYSKDFRKLAERQRDQDAFARAWSREREGLEEDDLGRVLLQMVQSNLFQVLLDQANAEEDKGPTPKQLMEIGRALKDVQSAMTLSIQRQIKMREEAEKAALKKAADTAEKAAKKAGLTKDTVAAIRAEILGVAA